jgi:hypothetical protein
MAGRVSFVKSVLASQVIYHLTPLTVPPGTLNYINKLERAFVWVAKDRTSGAKCNVNWKAVCRPKRFGGLGIVHMNKFATALRLRWPWLEWKDNDKIWAGSGNPCNDKDMEIFLGNGRNTSFWNAPLLEGKTPKDIAPKFTELCKRKKWTVAQALHDNEWMIAFDGAVFNSARELDGV